MDAILERSHDLKQALVDFVLDAEGEIAQALETYAAEQSRRVSGSHTQQGLILDSFIIEGKIADLSPIELFRINHPDLSDNERCLLNGWHQSFMGLFAIVNILPDGLELMNWLTAKHYIVKTNNSQTLYQLSRLKIGEILLTCIFPVTDNYWMLSNNYILMGKLGKPKLAVAIGNFKETYKNSLYSDAPDLLEEAWQSVETYHQQFVDFFGTDEITLPGYQLNKKFTEFQEKITQKILDSAGIDTSKSLAELAAELGVENSEIAATAKEFGADTHTISQIFPGKDNGKMVMPKVDLPAELKKAEQVTAISHPRWGQTFLSTYNKIKFILSTQDCQDIEANEKLIHYYLKDKSINTFIWHRLAEKYPTQLERVLQTVLQYPDFCLANDLNPLLQSYHKPIEPELPEIASVPLHLHNLFQEAIAEVNRSKPKTKVQKGATKGFQGF